MHTDAIIIRAANDIARLVKADGNVESDEIASESFADARRWVDALVRIEARSDKGIAAKSAALLAFTGGDRHALADRSAALLVFSIASDAQRLATFK